MLSLPPSSMASAARRVGGGRGGTFNPSPTFLKGPSWPVLDLVPSGAIATNSCSCLARSPASARACVSVYACVCVLCVYLCDS